MMIASVVTLPNGSGDCRSAGSCSARPGGTTWRRADVRVLRRAQLPGLPSPNPILGRRARRRAMAETDRALSSKIAGSADAPNVILQAHLALPFGDDSEQATVRPDVLIARSTDAM